MNIPPDLLLASQSPRRRMMLSWLGVDFAVTDGEVDETPVDGEPPAALAVRLAAEKAVQASRSVTAGWVLTADTVVDLDRRTLGKPSDAAEARAILAQLRDRSHQVHTAIVLVEVWSATHVVRCVTTDVQMRAYSAAEVDAYIATGDPFDKAGAYAIQHPGFHPVDGLHVCYANVVGLPLCAVTRALRDAGLGIDVDVPALCREHFGYDCPSPDEGRNDDPISTQRRRDAKE